MKYLVGFLAVAVVLGFAFAPASAQEAPSVGLHVAPLGDDLGVACDTGPATCSEMVLTGPDVPAGGGGPAYWVYLVGVPQSGNGVSGMQFGIWYEFNYVGGEYTGAYVDPSGFVKCSDLSIPGPNWPSPHSGITLTWNVASCETGVEFEIGGVMEVALYSAALMQITRNPNGQFSVANCQGAQSNIEFPAAAGWVAFGGASSGGDADGCNPCLETCASVATEARTWSGIKQSFGGE